MRRTIAFARGPYVATESVVDSDVDRAVDQNVPRCPQDAGLMLLKGLLFFVLMFVVNQVHFRWDTHIPGVAPINIVVVLILIAFQSKKEVLAKVRPRLLRPLLYFFGALTF